jgi:hypothetical protein
MFAKGAAKKLAVGALSHGRRFGALIQFGSTADGLLYMPPNL